MPAALKVADSPAAILAGLNRRALGHSHGGFTTRLVVCVDTHRRLTAANAGHLAPNLNGVELEFENGLPPGIDANANYAESTRQLKDRDRLVLITDGVVEADNATGTLFGFERTPALCGETVDQIARTSEEFGQEDDTTVLPVIRAEA
jgi:serine phosphatase RsbU (regulator of sigma subunit)